MKLAGFNLLIFVVPGILAAQPVPSAAPAPSARTSRRLTREIRTTLPRFVPRAPAEAGSGTSGAASSDPNLLVLPKVTVQEKRIPMDDPDLWLGERVIQQKAMAAYKASMTDLEWALNSWHIPFITPPASARARGAYEARKNMEKLIRLNEIVELTRLADPKASAELRKDFDKMNDAQDWQSRPAGSGRQK